MHTGMKAVAYAAPLGENREGRPAFSAPGTTRSTEVQTTFDEGGGCDR